MSNKRNVKSKTKLLAVCLIVISICLLAYAAYLQFGSKEDRSSIDKNADKKPAAEVLEKDHRQEIKDKLSGNCYSSDEDGVKTVIIFSDKDDSEKYQRITTIVYRDGSSPATEEQFFDISDDGKRIIYDPGSSKMERPIKVTDKKVVIDKISYHKDDIEKYTN